MPAKKRTKKPRKMKPTVVPVQKIDDAEFAALTATAKSTSAKVPGKRMTPAIVPYATVSNRKFKILRMKVVRSTTFVGTLQQVLAKLDKLYAKAPKGVVYDFQDITPRREIRIGRKGGEK